MSLLDNAVAVRDRILDEERPDRLVFDHSMCLHGFISKGDNIRKRL